MRLPSLHALCANGERQPRCETALGLGLGRFGYYASVLSYVSLLMRLPL